jgi:hypothetical protein
MPPYLRRLAPFGQEAASRPPDTTPRTDKGGYYIGVLVNCCQRGKGRGRPTLRQAESFFKGATCDACNFRVRLGDGMRSPIA